MFASNFILSQDSLVKDIEVGNYGDFKVGGLWCYLIHFGPNWQGSDQREGGCVVLPDEGYPKTADGTTEIRGKYKVKAGSELFEFTEKVAKASESSISFSASLENSVGIETVGTVLRIDLPAVEFAGKPLSFDDKQMTLPENGADHVIYHAEGISRIAIPLKDRKLIVEGAGLDVGVEDLRPLKLESFLLNIYFKPNSGQITKTAIDLKFTFSELGGKP
jgi:hypothetical protein